MLNQKTKELLQAAYGPPTDLEKFGELMGVVEIERKELKVDGMVLPKGAGYKIILNTKKARSRFSWAHEIGHIIVQSGSLAKPQFRGAPLSHKQLERLCDSIAAEILMPEEQFREHMAQLGFALTAVPKLARAFDSSIESTAIRFTEFLPFPAVLSKWSAGSDQPAHSWSHGNSKCRPYSYGMPKGNKAKDMSMSGHIQAFKSSNVVQTEEPLMVTRNTRGGERYQWKTFPTESMAIGYGENRYALSLSRVGETDVPVSW